MSRIDDIAGCDLDAEEQARLEAEGREKDYAAFREKVVVYYDPPPIPIRNHDWTAVTGDYEGGEYDYETGRFHGGAPIGHGATEQEAIDDLWEACGYE
jgi:hypothetical protein